MEILSFNSILAISSNVSLILIFMAVRTFWTPAIASINYGNLRAVWLRFVPLHAIVEHEIDVHCLLKVLNSFRYYDWHIYIFVRLCSLKGLQIRCASAEWLSRMQAGLWNAVYEAFDKNHCPRVRHMGAKNLSLFNGSKTKIFVHNCGLNILPKEVAV